MTTKHDYKAALEWLNHWFRGKTIYDGHPLQTVEHALKIADKLMQEPSDNMWDGDARRLQSQRDLKELDPLVILASIPIISETVADELRNLNHTITTGDHAVLIWYAMRDAMLKEVEE